MKFIFPTMALLLTGAIHGQTLTTGNATGLVTDASGAVVPGAAVTITYAATNEPRSTTTNETGRYRFLSPESIRSRRKLPV